MLDSSQTSNHFHIWWKLFHECCLSAFSSVTFEMIEKWKEAIVPARWNERIVRDFQLISVRWFSFWTLLIHLFIRKNRANKLCFIHMSLRTLCSSIRQTLESSSSYMPKEGIKLIISSLMHEAISNEKKKLEINGDTKAQEEKWFPLLTFNFLIMIFFDSNKLPTLTFLLFH